MDSLFLRVIERLLNISGLKLQYIKYKSEQHGKNVAYQGRSFKTDSNVSVC